MLSQLLNLLANKENGLSLMEISRAVEAQPSAVLAMLQTLVRKGRLIEIGPECGYCAACDLQSQCNLLAARSMRYAPVPAAYRSQKEAPQKCPHCG